MSESSILIARTIIGESANSRETDNDEVIQTYTCLLTVVLSVSPRGGGHGVSKTGCGNAVTM
jgi:hypothetical protein